MRPSSTTLLVIILVVTAFAVCIWSRQVERVAPTEKDERFGKILGEILWESRMAQKNKSEADLVRRFRFERTITNQKRRFVCQTCRLISVDWPGTGWPPYLNLEYPPNNVDLNEFERWLVDLMDDAVAIKAGVPCEDLWKSFTPDGGVQGIQNVRFCHRKCFNVQIEVNFQRAVNTASAASFFADDQPDSGLFVKSATAPYIDFVHSN
jgi:hypothetical protein